MRKETYNKNKQIFLSNYEKIKDKYLPLNIPIELLMQGIFGKQKFFTYYSHDCGAQGTNVVSSLNSYKVYYTWDDTPMSRLAAPTAKNMFRLDGTFKRFDQYIQERGKKK